MFRKLARKNKQLSEEECLQILTTEKRGVLSVVGDGGYPYGMPMNHYYHEEDGAIYFHCGKSGHRLDALKACDKVSFCVYNSGEQKDGAWALTIKSVIVFGTVTVIDDRNTIEAIAYRLSRKFTDDEEYICREIERFAAGTLLLRLDVEHLCGKVVEES